MKTITIFVLLLMIGLADERDPRQLESTYREDGECPHNCVTCQSATKCITCRSDRYGPICELVCPPKCANVCHKEYGICTGCKNGTYLQESTDRCIVCPINCTQCDSPTDCVECRQSHHGNTCQYPCITHCVMCDQNTGHCEKCFEGYFYKDKSCRKCPDGCSGCIDYHNCSACREGHVMLQNGQCIMDCLNIKYESDKSIATYVCIDTGRNPGFVNRPIMPWPKVNSTVDNDSGTCTDTLTYKCTDMCRLIKNSVYHCIPNCKSEDRNGIWASIYNISVIQECSPAIGEPVTSSDVQSDLKPLYICIGFLVALVCVLCLVIVFLSMKLWGNRSKGEETDPEAVGRMGQNKKSQYDTRENPEVNPPTAENGGPSPKVVTSHAKEESDETELTNVPGSSSSKGIGIARTGRCDQGPGQADDIESLLQSVNRRDFSEARLRSSGRPECVADGDDE